MGWEQKEPFIREGWMLRGFSRFLIAVALGVPFTIALTYATLWIPTAVIHRLLLDPFPDCWWPSLEETVWLRPWGYISFAITLVLMLAGWVTKWLKVAVSGSIVMFLPTFGYFAFAMFFLAGIGVLRVLWFPWLDVFPNILRLGDIVYLPYLLLGLLVVPVAWVADVSPAALNTPFSVMIMMSGIMVFFLGVVTWLYGRITKPNIIDFWVYRYSRHQQQLRVVVSISLSPILSHGARVSLPV